MNLTITAGHGGSDPGAVRAGINERDIMAALRDLVAMKLRSAGHTVRTDGGRLENWPLADALGLVPGADLAVELHTNAAASPMAHGVEVVAQPSRARDAQRLANAIAAALGTTTRKSSGWYDAEQHRKDRGWNSQAAFVRRGGLIVETFFLSNPQELAAFQERIWLVASAIASAMGVRDAKPD